MSKVVSWASAGGVRSSSLDRTMSSTDFEAILAETQRLIDESSEMIAAIDRHHQALAAAASSPARTSIERVSRARLAPILRASGAAASLFCAK